MIIAETKKYIFTNYGHHERARSADSLECETATEDNSIFPILSHRDNNRSATTTALASRVQAVEGNPIVG